MSLEKIIERIELDAENNIKEIKEKASATSEEIIKEAEKEAELIKASAFENAKKEAETRKQRIISSSMLEFRKEILAEKQSAIDSAFDIALDNLIKMKDDEYRKVIKNMILSNVQTGNEEIILSEKDKLRLGGNFLKDINNQLSKSGKKGNLTISKDTYNIAGGFILRRGSIELNSSFESLFNSSREDLESEVSKVLFPEE